MSAITDTQLKLQDAASQMMLALDHSDDDAKVRSCINAFISHARSVTLVMQKESGPHPALKAWYVAQREKLKTAPLFTFFNEKRRFSIHEGVVGLKKTSATITNVVVNGVESSAMGTITVLRFNDVEKYLPNDSGNVFQLCDDYYTILKWLVESWLRERKRLGIDS